MAGGARLRFDAVLRAGDGDPGARRDRAVAAPEPRRDELVGDGAAQAGGAVHGHDARDDVAAAVRDERPCALRQPGQGPGGAAAHADRRGPVVDSVHHRSAGRHRRDTRRTRRHLARDSQVAQGVRPCARSDRAELPGQGTHRHGRGPRRRHRGLPGDRGGGAAGAGPRDADSGPAEPGVPRRMPGADRRRGRRLGWCVTADARPCQPRAAVAGVGRIGRRHCRIRLRAGPAADRAAQIRAGGCGLDRPAGVRACPGAGRSGDRSGPRRQSGGAAVAGTRRRRFLGPRRPQRGDRHAGPQQRDPQRHRQRLRRLGVDPRARARAGRAGRQSAGTPAPRCAPPNATRPAAPTANTCRWPPPTVRRWKPLLPLRIRCAATPSATT